MADKINAAVFYDGVRYGPGDEEKLRNSGIGGRSIQGLRSTQTNDGKQTIIEGFDDLLGRKAKKVTPSGLAVDPTAGVGLPGQKHYAHGQEVEPAHREASEEDEDEEEDNPKKKKLAGSFAGDEDEDDGVGPEGMEPAEETEGEEGAPRRTRKRTRRGKKATRKAKKATRKASGSSE